MQEVNDGESETGGTYVAAGVTSFPFTAIGATEFVVSHISISGTDYRFQSPTFAQCPMVTICNATTIEISPQYMVFQSGYKRYLPDVEMSPMAVYTDKMSFELTTKPITDFGLKEIHIQFHVIAKFPGIVCSP